MRKDTGRGAETPLFFLGRSGGFRESSGGLFHFQFIRKILTVIPAKAGIQSFAAMALRSVWIPAFVGMTNLVSALN